MWGFLMVVCVLGVVNCLPQYRQEYVPVLSKSGVPVEPPELREARERHLKFLSAYQESNFEPRQYQERAPIVKNRQQDDWDFGRPPNNGLYSYNIEHIYGGTEEDDDGTYKETNNYNSGESGKYKQYEQQQSYDDGSYKSTKNEVNDDEDYDDGSYKEEKYEVNTQKEKKQHKENKPKKVESTTHYIPVIKNGVPVETKEVQEARLQHLTAHVRALERIKTIEENLSKQKKGDDNIEAKEPKKNNNNNNNNGKKPKPKQTKREPKEEKQSTQSFLKTVCITMHICSNK